MMKAEGLNLICEQNTRPTLILNNVEEISGEVKISKVMNFEPHSPIFCTVGLCRPIVERSAKKYSEFSV